MNDDSKRLNVNDGFERLSVDDDSKHLNIALNAEKVVTNTWSW